MTAIIPPQLRREILDLVGDGASKTPRELDAIACDYGLTLKELAQLVDQPRTPARVGPPSVPRPVQVLAKACTKCGETKPTGEFFPNKEAKDGLASWCRKCNNDRPRTPARMVEGRARGRAYRLLAQAHPKEFAALFAAETKKAIAEHQRVTAAAEARGQADAAVARIKSGPKRREQSDVIDRLDVARCSSCHTHHDADHLCPSCETSTDAWKDVEHNQEEAS